MSAILSLPAYTDEHLARLDPAELIDLLITDEDRVPRNLIDECARRGEAMADRLDALPIMPFVPGLCSAYYFRFAPISKIMNGAVFTNANFDILEKPAGVVHHSAWNLYLPSVLPAAQNPGPLVPSGEGWDEGQVRRFPFTTLLPRWEKGNGGMRWGTLCFINCEALHWIGGAVLNYPWILRTLPQRLNHKACTELRITP